MNRRRWLAALGAGIGSAAIAHVSVANPTAPGPLGFALTGAVVADDGAVIARWGEYLAARLSRQVRFSQGPRYRETMDRLKERMLDFAWLSTLPYVYLARRGYVRLVCAPAIAGERGDRAVLIVGADDRRTGGLADLGGKVFAYADPFSLSGRLWPQHLLREGSHDPATFFRKTFFAGAHRNVVEAVAVGVADAGAVSGFVLEALRRRTPELALRVRVVAESARFGFPPIVASRAAGDATVDAMRDALTTMQDTALGRRILESLGIDRFEACEPSQYDRAAQLVQLAGEP